jgi:acetyl-CoA acetyltransferase
MMTSASAQSTIATVKVTYPPTCRESPDRHGQPVTVDHDEAIRAGTDEKTLSRLPGAFHRDGTITAGNASPSATVRQQSSSWEVIMSPDVASAHQNRRGRSGLVCRTRGDAKIGGSEAL